MGTIQTTKKFHLKFINLFLLVMVVVSGALYLESNNDLMVKGFKLQELKKQSRNLADENQTISARKTALESYQNLPGRLNGLNMVAVDKIEYLTVNGETIARK
jgi:hypothetical protein